MKRRSGAALAAAILAVSAALTLSAAAPPGISFVGMGLIAGTALDKSGLAGSPICRVDDNTDCIDQATLGGFGSGLAYTGHDNVFLAVPDRGPFDGRTDVPFLDRIDFMHLNLTVGAPFPNITATLLDTRMLRDENGRSFVGDAYAYAGNAANAFAGLRLDPEAVVASGAGTFFVADEYGPNVIEFDRQGNLVRRIPVPARFLLDPVTGHASGDLDAPGGNSMELYPAFNVTGRQANRGMEGLAITPDGRTLVGIMQNALLQDNGLDPASIPSRKGLNGRILTFDLQTAETHEYVYRVDAISQGRGVNELLALNDHQFLVVERDNRSLAPTPPNTAQTPNNKWIYLIDLNTPNLTDVSNMDSLPVGASASIVPVSKVPFINLLDAAWKVNATQTIKDVIAEKIEGMAWGPDLPDGRHVLYVASDNDLYTARPTQIFAFAIDASAAGVTYAPQVLPGPMFPPGQVKKILGK